MPDTTADGCGSGRVTIDALSDDCLLCIFNHYRRYSEFGNSTWWHPLVHICRRWRHVAFSFPGYLNLRHVCKSKTHLKATLDVWPALPIDIRARFKDRANSDEDDIQASFKNCADSNEDDIIGALEYRDRIAGISLWEIRSAARLEKCITSMQEPFPLLTSLHLDADAKMKFVVTDAFLGGSAPCLRKVSLTGVRFPTLPILLSSSSHLVNLQLENFPIIDSGHWLISPEAMATCVSVLTRLQTLRITVHWGFHPPSQPPPEVAPTIFPALTFFMLAGPHEYFRDLIARVDAPQLDTVYLYFCGGPILDFPRLTQFIQRTEISKFPRRLDVYFNEGPGRKEVQLSLRSSIIPAKFNLLLPCTEEITTQLELMERICALFLFLFSQVKWLQIDSYHDLLPRGPRSTMSERWLGFLQPFTAVEALLFPRRIVTPHVATALASLTETRAAEVLPKLQTILITGSQSDLFQVTELLNPFIVARDQANCPVTVKITHSD